VVAQLGSWVRSVAIRASRANRHQPRAKSARCNLHPSCNDLVTILMDVLRVYLTYTLDRGRWVRVSSLRDRFGSADVGCSAKNRCCCIYVVEFLLLVCQDRSCVGFGLLLVKWWLHRCSSSCPVCAAALLAVVCAVGLALAPAASLQRMSKRNEPSDKKALCCRQRAGRPAAALRASRGQLKTQLTKRHFIVGATRGRSRRCEQESLLA